MNSISKLKIAASILTLALAAVPASALSVPFSFSGNPGGGTVNVSATVTTGAGTISVTLNNLLNDPSTVAQLISQFNFTLSGAGSGTVATLDNTSQPSRTINTTAPGGYVNGNSSTTALWFLPDGTGPTLSLSGLNPGDPAGLVIGGPNGANAYASAGGSIAGNGPHNPFFLSGVTFSLTAPGVTAATNVTAATFFFGTQAEFNSGGTVVPDGGSTAILLGLASLGLGLFARRFRRS